MNWKAYEEVEVNPTVTQRWVREGDEYVNRMSLEQMEKFKDGVDLLKATINYMFEQEIKSARVKANENHQAISKP